MPRNSQVNFYLKPADKNGKCLIYLQFKYAGNRLFYSFSQKIEKTQWNKGKQRVKNTQQTTEDGNYLLNDLLKNLEDECNRAYKQEIANGIPSTEKLSKYLDAVLNRDDRDINRPTFYKLVQGFINGEIRSRQGKLKSKGTLKNYRVTLSHLKAFELKTKYRVDFDTINLDFHSKFLTFLENPVNIKLAEGKEYKREGLSTNSIGNQIKNVITFMNEALEQELTTNLQFRKRKFVKPSEDTDAVHLTDSEIMRLYSLDLSYNNRLDQVRDLFCFGCSVGLRFSDYSDVRPENIIEDDGQLFIKVKPKKTGDYVIIPCNSIVLQIFEKYKENSNRLPKAISNQKFNEYIKEVCQIAGFNETGRLDSDLTKELWECISSHTCRRSFATNLYLEGFPPIEIMKITGHKTETAFLRYIKVQKLNAAKRLAAHMKETWSKKMLRVA